jgi:hypothetical protein
MSLAIGSNEDVMGLLPELQCRKDSFGDYFDDDGMPSSMLAFLGFSGILSESEEDFGGQFVTEVKNPRMCPERLFLVVLGCHLKENVRASGESWSRYFVKKQ